MNEKSPRASAWAVVYDHINNQLMWRIDDEPEPEPEPEPKKKRIISWMGRDWDLDNL